MSEATAHTAGTQTTRQWIWVISHSRQHKLSIDVRGPPTVISGGLQAALAIRTAVITRPDHAVL